MFTRDALSNAYLYRVLATVATISAVQARLLDNFIRNTLIMSAFNPRCVRLDGVQKKNMVTIVWSDVAMTLLMIGWKSFGISWAKAAITLLVLVSPFIVVKCYNYLSNRYNFSISPSNPEKRKWIMFGIYFSTLLMAISFLYEGQMTFDPSADVTNMTWTQYDRHCSLSSANTIENQIRCSQLKGTAINWKGTVQSVRVVNIDNSFETLLGYLPESIGQTLRCFYDSNRTTEDVEGMR
ncbi:unnamed protein product [Nippostrongylus brasiliensis]|uniref:Wolframin (inferred by orthology to a human protein) n=1 Tax=Nippostrongylus brasiliensis TaxID=27835 RepID=A0A0N4YA59_NIPBR|nr:unnamed protein product [Nippostrongylus brasiliensis]